MNDTSYEFEVRGSRNGTYGTATVHVLQGGQVVHSDKGDLAAAPERLKLAGRLAEHLGVDDKKLFEALTKSYLERLNRDREEEAARRQGQDQDGGAPESVDARAERLLKDMPEDVRQEAEDCLREPDLLDRAAQDVEALGVAGEDRLTRTLYLLGTSRLLPRPLAMIAKGPTASGKSYVVEKVSRLFPPEAVLRATSLTPQSLYYMEKGALRHRWVVAGERSRKEDDDTAEATRALREMISSGRLSKLIPLKDEGGMLTALIEQEGPIAYVESTTRERVFDEDENRMLSVYTDEQPGQTRRVLERLAADAAGGRGGGDVERVVLRHHAMQRMLRQCHVVIPYAEELGRRITDERVEARRAFPHLLAMVQALTLLYQFQRERDADGALVATEWDYEWARWLLEGPLSRLLGTGLSRAARRFLRRLEKWFGDAIFTTTEVRRKEKVSKPAVWGWLRELNDAGLAEVMEEGRGRKPATWRLKQGQGVEQAAKAEKVLPEAEELFPCSPRNSA
jgi:hypothetical protein